jgi:hypothetical protein
MNAEHLKAGRGRGYCGTLTFSGLAETVIWRLPAWIPTFQEEKIRRRDRESRDEEKARFLGPSSKRTGLLMVELECGKQSKMHHFISI